MKNIINLSGLLTDTLKNLYASEKQQLEDLPKVAEQANTPELRQLLDTHIRNKRQNVDRLQQAFSLMDVNTRGHRDDAVESVLQQCNQTINKTAQGSVADAAIIGAIQRLNHLNIANFGTAAAHAKALGQEEIAQIMHKSLLGEKATDEKLSILAENSVNRAALVQA